MEQENSSSIDGPGSALRDLRTAVEALTEEAGPPAEPAAEHLPSAPEPRDAPADTSSRVKTVKEESFPVWRLGSVRYNPRSQTYVSFFECLEKIELYCSKKNNNEKSFSELRFCEMIVLVLAFLDFSDRLQHDVFVNANNDMS